jgi:hypothetical protein
MPYVDQADGSTTWLYEHKPETTGDPLRIAGQWLAYNIESFLYDYNHPGYAKPEYLSWCLAHFDVMQAGAVPMQLTWDPGIASGQPDRSGQPRNSADTGLRYPQAAFDAPHIDTSGDGPGESENYGPGEVEEPFMARYNVNGPAVVTGVKYAAPVVEAPAEDAKIAKLKKDAADGKDGS